MIVADDLKFELIQEMGRRKKMEDDLRLAKG